MGDDINPRLKRFKSENVKVIILKDQTVFWDTRFHTPQYLYDSPGDHRVQVWISHMTVIDGRDASTQETINKLQSVFGLNDLNVLQYIVSAYRDLDECIGILSHNGSTILSFDNCFISYKRPTTINMPANLVSMFSLNRFVDTLSKYAVSPSVRGLQGEESFVFIHSVINKLFPWECSTESVTLEEGEVNWQEKKKLKSYIDNCKYSRMFVKLNIGFQGGGGHSTLLYLNKITEEFHLLDPNGAYDRDDIQWAMTEVNMATSFKSDDTPCPLSHGPQRYDRVVSVGLCVSWTFLMLILQLCNPTLSTHDCFKILTHVSRQDDTLILRFTTFVESVVPDCNKFNCMFLI